MRVPILVTTLQDLSPGEAAARDARHAALARAARESGAAAIALGHTLDDQFETLLLRLIRGAGTRGMSAMRDSEMGPAGVCLVRPLLGVTRQAIDAYVRDQGLEPLEDPTNADPAFADRNRIRHDVVPVLRELNPRVADAANRTARILADDDEALEAVTAVEWDRIVRSGTNPALPLTDFNLLPLAIRRRLVRRLSPGLDFAQVDQVIGFAKGQRPAHAHLPGGLLAVRQEKSLWIANEPPPNFSECRICLTRGRALPSMEADSPHNDAPSGRANEKGPPS